MGQSARDQAREKTEHKEDADGKRVSGSLAMVGASRETSVIVPP
ncbi:MAG: hypothetical protein AAGA05_13575 [Pseudomonadota bacterium]